MLLDACYTAVHSNGSSGDEGMNGLGSNDKPPVYMDCAFLKDNIRRCSEGHWKDVTFCGLQWGSVCW